VEFSMDANHAVNSPRFHHQLWPKNLVKYHSGIDKSVLTLLDNLGYKTLENNFGDLQLIMRKNDNFQAASEDGEYSRGVSIVVE